MENICFEHWNVLMNDALKVLVGIFIVGGTVLIVGFVAFFGYLVGRLLLNSFIAEFWSLPMCHSCGRVIKKGTPTGIKTFSSSFGEDSFDSQVHKNCM